MAHTDLYKTKALVKNTGVVFWSAPVTWRVACSFDVTWFPIDKQVRNMIWFNVSCIYKGFRRNKIEYIKIYMVHM